MKQPAIAERKTGYFFDVIFQYFDILDILFLLRNGFSLYMEKYMKFKLELMEDYSSSRLIRDMFLITLFIVVICLSLNRSWICLQSSVCAPNRIIVLILFSELFQVYSLTLGAYRSKLMVACQIGCGN